MVRVVNKKPADLTPMSAKVVKNVVLMAKKCKNRPPMLRTRLIGVVAGSAHPFPKGFSQLAGSSDQNGVNFPPNPSKLPEMLVKNGVFMHDNGRKGPWSD